MSVYNSSTGPSGASPSLSLAWSRRISDALAPARSKIWTHKVQRNSTARSKARKLHTASVSTSGEILRHGTRPVQLWGATVAPAPLQKDGTGYPTAPSQKWFRPSFTSPVSSDSRRDEVMLPKSSLLSMSSLDISPFINTSRHSLQ